MNMNAFRKRTMWICMTLLTKWMAFLSVWGTKGNQATYFLCCASLKRSFRDLLLMTWKAFECHDLDEMLKHSEGICVTCPTRENIVRVLPEAAASHRTKRFIAEPTVPLDTSAFKTVGPKKQDNQSPRYLMRKWIANALSPNARGISHTNAARSFQYRRALQSSLKRNCFLRLNPAHRFSAHYARPCFKCNLKHHRALCDSKTARF